MTPQEALKSALSAAKDRLSALETEREQLAEEVRRLERALTVLEEPRGVRTGPGVQRAGRTSHSGKYKDLHAFLLRSSGKGPLRLSFVEIEQVIGFPLPPSSRRHLPHWYGYEGS